MSEDYKPNPYEDAKSQLREAQKILGFSEGDYDMLASPRREMSVSIPIRRDDGTHEVLHGYRVQHNLIGTPCRADRPKAASVTTNTSILTKFAPYPCG